MRVTIFCHSLVSDWNHGNAHFLRGVCSELIARGHAVPCSSRPDAWSVPTWSEHGERRLPASPAPIRSCTAPATTADTLDLDAALADADLVLVHEWSDHALVQAHRHAPPPTAHYRLLFHDTHHRSVTEPDSMAAYDLRHYDGVLAFGSVIRDLYRAKGWAAAPGPGTRRPTRACSIRCRDAARRRPGLDRQLGRRRTHRRTARVPAGPVKAAAPEGASMACATPTACARGTERRGHPYGGWLPNYKAPEVFARYKRDGARAAPALRAGAAGHSDHPRVRGAGLRHSAGQRALGRRRRPVLPRRRLSRGARRRGHAAAPARRAQRPRVRALARAPGAADGARPPYLRAPGGRALRHPGGARGTRGTRGTRGCAAAAAVAPAEPASESAPRSGPQPRPEPILPPGAFAA
jgi:hypothetical protein